MVVNPEFSMDIKNNVWPWYALRVRARCEKRTASLLNHKGYEWFLPLYKCKRYWSDRIKEFELPLFPGYFFCRVDLQHRLPILKTPGVLNIVGIGKAPVPVDEEEIAAIQSIVQSGLPAQPWPFLQVGQKVRINQGALCGLEGIVANSKGCHRLIVSVTLLRRSVAVELDGAWVSAISPLDHIRPAGQPGHLTGNEF